MRFVVIALLVLCGCQSTLRAINKPFEVSDRAAGVAGRSRGPVGYVPPEAQAYAAAQAQAAHESNQSTGTVDGFCDGHQLGYARGYCEARGYGCVRPITPICPIRKIGQSTFQDGYDQGFVDGMANGRR